MLGTEGPSVTEIKNILIADYTEHFAAAMVSVLVSQNLARILGSRPHGLVEKHYSSEQ